MKGNRGVTPSASPAPGGTVREAGIYTLSLPERSVRALSVVVGGLSKLVTDTLLPRSLRKTSFYWYLVGNTQRFLVSELGGVRQPGRKVPDKYLLRKSFGNVAEVAGILAFHFSPLWFFALVEDASRGAKRFLRQVVSMLKRDGALPRGKRIDSAERLLDALSRAGGKSAARLKFPPLSRREASRQLRDLRRCYAEVYRSTKKALPPPAVLLEKVLRICKREKVSFLRLTGTMALASARAGTKATGDLLRERVIGSYARSLREVRKRGFRKFFAREAHPYLRAVLRAFSPSNVSSTERLLR